METFTQCAEQNVNGNKTKSNIYFLIYALSGNVTVQHLNYPKSHTYFHVHLRMYGIYIAASVTVYKYI